jgi:hypothetical protein
VRVVIMDGSFSGRDASIRAAAGGMPRGAFGRNDPSRTPASVGSADVDAVLARFPGPVTLHVSRLKFVGLAAASLGFVVALLYILKDDALSPSGTAKAWLGIAFLSIGALVGVVMLLPGAGSLTLGPDGFERVSLFFRWRRPWRRVGNFAVGQYSPRRGRTIRFVAYDDADVAPDNFTRRISGRNAALPDTYGLAHEDLAGLMNQWRAQALRA